MKTILICPGERTAVAALWETAPLSNFQAFGKPLIAHWLDHLAARGVRAVTVLATDRPEQTRALVGTGARWGLRVEVIPEIRELSAAQARRKYRKSCADKKQAAPETILMDHLPGLPEFPLFDTYGSWISALREWMPRAATPDRIGVHEIRPGVWVGLHARISPQAELRAPCWIGEDVDVGAGTVVGPMAVLEDRSYVEPGAEIFNSAVGADTFVGEFAEVHDSIALGNTLIHCKLNSATKVDDAFLLCSLVESSPALATVGILSRLAALATMIVTFPLALLPILLAKWHGWTAFRSMVAVRPGTVLGSRRPEDTFRYFELTGAPGWLRRWPQLWKIVWGEFAWVGNRPLHPRLAARLTNEFERLWLTGRPGLISLADTETRRGFLSDEARAHASFYAVQADWRLDCRILARAFQRLGFGLVNAVGRECARALSLTAAAKEQGQEAF